jgi:hypothetical protein
VLGFVRQILWWMVRCTYRPFGLLLVLVAWKLGDWGTEEQSDDAKKCSRQATIIYVGERSEFRWKGPCPRVTISVARGPIVILLYILHWLLYHQLRCQHNVESCMPCDLFLRWFERFDSVEKTIRPSLLCSCCALEPDVGF